MENFIRLVKDIIDERKVSPEEQLQLNVICELEDKFVKDFSKDKWNEYLNLDLAKGKFHNIQIEKIIEITFSVCKQLFVGK